MEFFNPSIEQLVTEIIAVNQAWKEAKDLFGEPASLLANSLRDLKARLQVRLLRNYAPEKVYLMIDTNVNADYDEPLYGLQLVTSVNGRRDAAHMPIRVAQENLLASELEQFVRS
jgi:hypothetical protein